MRRRQPLGGARRILRILGDLTLPLGRRISRSPPPRNAKMRVSVRLFDFGKAEVYLSVAAGGVEGLNAYSA